MARIANNARIGVNLGVRNSRIRVANGCRRHSCRHGSHISHVRVELGLNPRSRHLPRHHLPHRSIHFFHHQPFPISFSLSLSFSFYGRTQTHTHTHTHTRARARARAHTQDEESSSSEEDGAASKAASKESASDDEAEAAEDDVEPVPKDLRMALADAVSRQKKSGREREDLEMRVVESAQKVLDAKQVRSPCAASRRLGLLSHFARHGVDVYHEGIPWYSSNNAPGQS